MILANVWKYRVGYKQFFIHNKRTQIQAMSSDRKRTGEGINLNDDEGNYLILLQMNNNSVFYV